MTYTVVAARRWLAGAVAMILSAGLLVGLGLAPASAIANPPSPPTDLVVTPGDGQLSVAFTPGPSGGSPIIDYEYRVSSSAPGTPDTAFNDNIGQTFDSVRAVVNSVVVDGDGKVLVGGAFFSPSTAVARFNADGTSDTVFNTTMGSTVAGEVNAVVVQPDGKILVGGRFSSPAKWVARFNADGTPDTDFNTAIGSAFNDIVTSLALQSDGKILVGGGFTTPSTKLARFNADGTPDETFNTAVGDSLSAGGWVQAVAVDSSGRVIVGGDFSGTSNSLARFSADGVADDAFNAAVGDTLPAEVRSVAIDAEDRVVVAGYFGIPSGGVARFNTDGTLDQAFSTTLGNVLAYSGSEAVVIDSEGRIVVGGGYFVLEGDSLISRALARLNPDGSLDMDFSTGLGLALDSDVLAVALDSDFNIVVGGKFNRPVDRLARFGSGWGPWTSAGTDSSPVTITGLTNGITYDVQLRAVNAVGEGEPSEVVQGTPAQKSTPAAPTNLAPVPGYQKATVYFTPGADGGNPITNYEYSIDGGTTWLALDPAVTGSPVVIPDLINGVTYELLLRAVNDEGAGEASDPTYFIPLGAAFVPVEPYRAYDSRNGDGPLAGGQSRTVVTDLPEGAVAVAYNLTATGMTGSGLLSVSPAGAPAGGTSTLNYAGPGQTWANAFTSGVDESGQIQVAATGAPTQFIVDVVGYYTPQAGPLPPVEPEGGAPAEVSAADDVPDSRALFVPITPLRTYDSRDIGAGGPLAGGASRVVNVTAGGVVPPEATAVAYTLTQTGTVATGYLAVGPAGAPQPDVSSSNWFTSNQTSANSSMVAIDDAGNVQVWAGTSPGGSAQFVIDVLGYYVPESEAPWAGGFTPIDPQRAYDSRIDEPAGPISGGDGFTTSMAVDGVPPDAAAVAFNLTATGGTGTGFLTTVPGDVLSPPVASTLNWWQPNQTLANGSVVDVPNFNRVVKALGEEVEGTLALPVTTYAGGGSTQYIIDVAGYYTFSPRG